MKFFLAFWPDLRPHRRLLLCGLLAGIITGIASGAGAPYFMKVVFAEVFENQDQGYTLLQILLIAAQLPGIFLLRGLSGYAYQYLMTQAGLEALRSIRQRVFDQIQSLPLAYFERQRTGELISRLVSDTQQVQVAIMNLARET